MNSCPGQFDQFGGTRFSLGFTLPFRGKLFDITAATKEESATATNRILVALHKTEGASWFIKLTGDAALVEQQRIEGPAEEAAARIALGEWSVSSASGGRSALVGKTLKDMGYENVRNLGGFKGWVDSGGAVEKA